MTALGSTILIVDDVAFVRKTLHGIFTQAGYRVVGEAADGAEAIELFAKLNPQLVTMDVVMPQMSGIEATRRIMRQNPSARVVMVSAMGQENLVMEAIHVGARDYVLKPFSAQDILKTAERVLSEGAGEKISRPAEAPK